MAVNTAIALLLEDGESADATAPPAAIAPRPRRRVDAKRRAEPRADSGPAAAGRHGAAAQRCAAGEDEDRFFTNTQTLTVREALRDAMAEEMRADDRVFVMGEEVAEYQGAYKVSQGLLQEFGDRRVIDTPITETASPVSALAPPLAICDPIVEFMTFNFAMQAMDHIINSAAKTLYMSGGQMGCPSSSAGPTAPRRGSPPSTRSAMRAGTPIVRASRWSRRGRRPTPRACSSPRSAIPNPVVFLENEVLYGQSFDVPTDPDRARSARPRSCAPATT